MSFELVWNNQKIRKEILEYLHLFKFYRNVTIHSLKELQNHKYKLAINNLYYDSLDPITSGDIPSNVTSIIFGNFFNSPITKGIITNNIQTIVFGYAFNQPLVPYAIPNSVQSITFGRKFNQQIKRGDIPSSCKSLTFKSRRFDQIIKPESIVPKSVIEIHSNFMNYLIEPISLLN